MAVCGEHKDLDRKVDHIIEVVNRLDHGMNGVDGSVGLVERVENMEAVITSNAPVWSKMRGLASNTSILLRTLAVAFLVALGSGLGGYIWVIVTGVGH